MTSFVGAEVAYTTTNPRLASFVAAETAYATNATKSGSFAGIEVAYVEGTPPPPGVPRRPMPIIAG